MMPKYTPNHVMWDNTDSQWILECPIVYFNPYVLSHANTWSNGTVDFTHADQLNNYVGAIVKSHDIDGPYINQERIWRLTGNRDEHGGYEGRWPD